MLSVGRYQLLDTLGEGGMGVVYKAFDPLIGRTVAVKLISARLTESPQLRERFFSEARAAGQLSHRNIVTIFDLGEDNGHPYFAMEYLEGRNLRVRLQSFERMSLSRKLEIMSYLCEGLAYAHSRGITHRDVKPANVFITDTGEVKVLDFGLARLPASELTHSKTLIGTLNYMAPEQIAGEKIDHRTDIFAVGVVFYEVLSGRSPFEADSVAALLNKILREEAQPLGVLDATIPSGLNALVSRAMAKAREDRYQSLNELLIDLAECRALIRDSDAGFINPEDLDVTRPVPGSGARLRSGSSGSHQRPASSPPEGPVPTSKSATPSGPNVAGGSGDAAPVPQRRRARGWMIAAAALALVAVAAGASWFVRQGPRERADGQHAVVTGPTTSPAASAPTASAPTASAPPAEATPGPGPTPAQTPRGSRDPATAAPAGTSGPSRAPAPAPRSARPKAAGDPGSTAGPAEAEAVREAWRAPMKGADAANASELASPTYRAAADSADAANRLLERGEYPLAVEKAREAGDLFRRAEREALAEQERRRQPPPSPPAEAKPAAPPPAPASPPPNPAPPDPAAAPAPGASAPPAAAEGAIRELLARYVQALEMRDLSALKRIWPNLSGVQERALRDEFALAKSIDVSLDSPALEISNGTATAVCRRRYALVTEDGHHLESRNTSVFSLRRQGSSWVIDSVRHDAAR